MTKICDHTSVGQIIYDSSGRIVMIERENYPRAFSLPAGHCDGDAPLRAAPRETEEEVGLIIKSCELIWQGTLHNQCKREGGVYHHWTLYKAAHFDGFLKSGSDAKTAFWASPADLQKFAKRTEYFMSKYGVAYDKVWLLTLAIFGDPKDPDIDAEWQQQMGLEPVWYYILKQNGLLNEISKRSKPDIADGVDLDPVIL